MKNIKYFFCFFLILGCIGCQTANSPSPTPTTNYETTLAGFTIGWTQTQIENQLGYHIRDSWWYYADSLSEYWYVPTTSIEGVTVTLQCSLSKTIKRISIKKDWPYSYNANDASTQKGLRIGNTTSEAVALYGNNYYHYEVGSEDELTFSDYHIRISYYYDDGIIKEIEIYE